MAAPVITITYLPGTSEIQTSYAPDGGKVTAQSAIFRKYTAPEDMLAHFQLCAHLIAHMMGDTALIPQIQGTLDSITDRPLKPVEEA